MTHNRELYMFIKSFVVMTVSKLLYRDYFKLSNYKYMHTKDITFTYKDSHYSVRGVMRQEVVKTTLAWTRTFYEINDEDMLMKIKKYMIENI